VQGGVAITRLRQTVQAGTPFPRQRTRWHTRKTGRARRPARTREFIAPWIAIRVAGLLRRSGGLGLEATQTNSLRYRCYRGATVALALGLLSEAFQNDP
jgi:hypothetical protein